MLIVNASDLTRLIPCNGSRLLQADPVYIEHDNTIREEGNAAHWLALTAFTGKNTVEELVDQKAPNGVYITAEMVEHVSEYIAAVGLLGNDVEWAYSFAGNGWQINGRADLARWECHPNDQYENPYIVRIQDFKYGYSIIEPEMNWTMIAHAIGYCIEKRLTPEWVIFTVHQPRAPHHRGRVRDWTISYVRLLELYQELSNRLSNLDSFLNTGSHCYKCPSFASCPARQNAELNAIETSHIAYNAAIDNVDLAARLDQIKRAQELLKQSEKAYQELATHRVQKGEVVKNYLMKTDLGNTTWKPFVTPELLDIMGVGKLCKRKLPTMKDVKAELSETVMSSLTFRPNNGTKLVRMDADKKARAVFGTKTG